MSVCIDLSAYNVYICRTNSTTLCCCRASKDGFYLAVRVHLFDILFSRPKCGRLMLSLASPLERICSINICRLIIARFSLHQSKSLCTLVASFSRNKSETVWDWDFLREEFKFFGSNKQFWFERLETSKILHLWSFFVQRELFLFHGDKKYQIGHSLNVHLFLFLFLFRYNQ